MSDEMRIYGPPGCLSKDTCLAFRRGKRHSGRVTTIEEAYYRFNRIRRRDSEGWKYLWNPGIETQVMSLISEGVLRFSAIDQIVISGIKETYQLTVVSGKSIRVTYKHPFRVPNSSPKADAEGFTKLYDLEAGDKVLCRKFKMPREEVIESIEFYGKEETYDIVMKLPQCNYVANDFIVHNTGKTTWAAKKAVEYAEKYGGDQVSMCSLTNTAIKEVVDRKISIPRKNITTLHSRCKRALFAGPPAETNIKAFIDENKKWSSASGSQPCLPSHMVRHLRDKSLSEDILSGGQMSLFEHAQILRQQMIPKDRWPELTRKFSEVWEDWCEQTGQNDFTGWLETILKNNILPPQKVIFVDEAQDHSPLQLAVVRSWRAERVYLIGDDDQCQPHETQVLTDRGYKPIEDLNESEDRLVTYDRAHSNVIGFRRGYSFKKIKHEYTGYIYEVTAGKKSTKTTAGHIWEVRWTEEAKSKYVVYLMKRDTRYRIGQCSLLNSEKSLNLGVRARAEKADALWILRICDSKFESTEWERLFSARYGVLETLFEIPISERTNGLYRSKKHLAEFWEKAKILKYDNLPDLSNPFWVKGDNARNKSGAQIFSVVAANLFSEIMSVPVHSEEDERKVEWYPLTVTKEKYTGYTYGLNVNYYHRYVADGIITHNCLYEWSGSVPGEFFKKTANLVGEEVLSQSYRVPRTVFKVANQLVKRISQRKDKEYHPRDFEGSVNYLDYSISDAYYDGNLPDGLLENPDETYMIIASCAYMLNSIIDNLKMRRIPFHNPYRPSMSKWNPLRTFIRCIEAYEVGDRMWTGDEAATWAEILRSKDVFNPRMKQRFLDLCISLGTSEIMERDIDKYFLKRHKSRILRKDITFLKEEKAYSKEFDWDYAWDVHGSGDYKPRLIVGTVHSVKGSEADNVYIFPDLSAAGLNEYLGVGSDRIHRLFYVGVTRAKKNLFLCTQGSQYRAIQWD